jgi:hypothetical protein
VRIVLVLLVRSMAPVAPGDAGWDELHVRGKNRLPAIRLHGEELRILR